MAATLYGYLGKKRNNEILTLFISTIILSRSTWLKITDTDGEYTEECVCGRYLITKWQLKVLEKVTHY